MLRPALSSVLMSALVTTSSCRDQPPSTNVGRADSLYVADAPTAIQIAEKVCIATYGTQLIASERPFTATLRGEVWEVSGSLPKNTAGGVAEVRILKRNGRVVSVIHGQ
jgi:hypothetical protein